MGKHEEGSAKWLSSRMKGRGLAKVKYYCQMCLKQCRDAHGYKCHVASESHAEKMREFAKDPEKYIAEFSEEFQDRFLAELDEVVAGMQNKAQFVKATEVYSVIVRDKEHVHLSATRWENFTAFLAHLESEGVIRMRPDESKPGNFEIMRLDPEAEARAEREAKKRKQVLEEKVAPDHIDERLKKIRSMGVGSEEITKPTELSRSGGERVKIVLGNRNGVSSTVSLRTTDFENIDAADPEELLDTNAVVVDETHDGGREKFSGGASNPSNWKDCIVKVVSGVHAGQKGVVLQENNDGLMIELIKSGEAVSETIRNVETVIPNLNRKVRVVLGTSEMVGKDGILLSVDIERGLATVLFSNLGECHDFKFDHICKFATD